MSDSKATRLHSGDKALKVNPKTHEVVSKAKHSAAKQKGSPLEIWRKVCKEYLQKGGEFMTIPKKGTNEHKELVAKYKKKLAASKK